VDVQTGGGTGVGGDVGTGGGSFVGRDRQQNNTTVNVDLDTLFDIRADMSKIHQEIGFIQYDISALRTKQTEQATSIQTLHAKTDTILQTQSIAQQQQRSAPAITVRDAISLGLSLLIVIAVAVLIGIYIGGLAR
jgi:hypothetical protein